MIIFVQSSVIVYIYTYVCIYIYSRKSTRNLGSYRGLLLAVESFISDALVLMLFEHVQTYMTCHLNSYIH